MKCWKNSFDEKTLKNALKFKDDITDISNDGYTFKACVKGRYHVELIIQDNILYDMSCTCSKKSGCAHEAALLYFLEEFPEILEDFNEKNTGEVIRTNVEYTLNRISPGNLLKFVRHEFRNDPKLKYRFAKYFERESIIDKKEYERKLKDILKYGKEDGFKKHGHYDIRRVGTPLKKFLRDDLEILITQKEYELAYRLVDEITSIFMDEYYWDTPVWYDMMDYCSQHCYTLSTKSCLIKSEREKMRQRYERIDYMTYKLKF